MFELIRAISTLTNFYDDWGKNITARVLTNKCGRTPTTDGRLSTILKAHPEKAQVS
jgi:hypothetical protein